MKFQFHKIIILLLVLVISACTHTDIALEKLEPNETLIIQPLIPTISSPLPLTPTANPYLLSDGIQPNDSVIFGNGAIEKMFVSKEHQNVLVQTHLGIFLFDLNSMERLGYKQTDLEVLSFNGYDGYLLTHFDSASGVLYAKRYGIDEPDLTHFLWDDEFIFDQKIYLQDWDGSNLVLLQASISPESSYIFGREDFRDNENNKVGISSNRYNYGFWKDFNNLPTNFFSDQRYFVWSQDIVFSPDESKLAFLGEVGGTGMSLGDMNVFLAVITEEGLSIPKKFFKHSDWHVAIDFSPDSQKIVSADKDGEVMVYWAEDQSQKVFYMTEEDLVDNGDYFLVRDARFLDNEHIAATTSSGNLVVWDINTEEKQVYSLGVDTPISFYPLDNKTIIYCTNNGIFKYRLDNQTYQELNYDFGPIRSKDLIIGDKMVSVIRLGNSTAELEVWDLKSYSKILTKTLDYHFPGGYYVRPEPFALQDGNVLIGAETDGTETGAILEIDTHTWDVITANPGNTEVSFEFGLLYSEALDKYIAVGSNKYELVLTSSDDPIFMNIDERKKTLREIRDIDISKDGTQVFVLEKNGLLQVFNLIDPSLSKSITQKGLLENIISLNNDQILTYGFYSWTPYSQNQIETSILDISTGEIEKIQIDYFDKCCKSRNIWSNSDYPDGFISIEWGNGIAVYDMLSDKVIEEHYFKNSDKDEYFNWHYGLFPESGYILGKDYYGYFKIKKIDSILN